MVKFLVNICIWVMGYTLVIDVIEVTNPVYLMLSGALIQGLVSLVEYTSVKVTHTKTDTE